MEFLGCFFPSNFRLQAQIESWRCVHSVLHAMAWYLFEVVHHINMLI